MSVISLKLPSDLKLDFFISLDLDVIENCLLILWRHLDYFLLRCEPIESATSLYKTHAQRANLRRLQGTRRNLAAGFI